MADPQPEDILTTNSPQPPSLKNKASVRPTDAEPTVMVDAALFAIKELMANTLKRCSTVKMLVDD